jgi:hypothetical protein
MYENWSTKKRIRSTACINGKLIEYDLCDTGEHLAPQNHLLDHALYLFLGTGTIYYQVDDVNQKNANIAYHFWRIISLAEIKEVFSETSSA